MNMPTNIANSDNKVLLMKHLQTNEQLEPKVSSTIASWWNDRESILILNEPLEANSSLAANISKLVVAPFYVVSFSKNTKKAEKAMVFGLLAQALEDANEDVMVVIDELDKIPSEEAFEELLAEFLLEATITISELNSRIIAKSGKRPHIIIKTQAKHRDLKDCFSPMVLRRSHYASLSQLIGN